MKASRSLLTLVILCASLSLAMLILFPVFAYAAASVSANAQISTPTTQPDCLRHPGSEPAAIAQKMIVAYTTVQGVSSKTNETDYLISVPLGLFPNAQQKVTLVVSADLQKSQLNNVVFQPGTLLRIVAALKDPQTLQAFEVQPTDQSTYAYCQTVVRFLDAPPQTLSNGRLVYWQVGQYMLSFDLQHFPVDLQSRIAVLVFFQDGQPLVQSVEKI